MVKNKYRLAVVQQFNLQKKNYGTKQLLLWKNYGTMEKNYGTIEKNIVP